MKTKIMILLLTVFIISSCSLFKSGSCHICDYNYRLQIKNGGADGYDFLQYKNEDNCVFKVIAEGSGQQKLDPYFGAEGNFDAINYALSSIKNGTLAGSWLDTCKMRLVYWKSDDVAMSNALIEVKRIEDSIK